MAADHGYSQAPIGNFNGLQWTPGAPPGLADWALEGSGGYKSAAATIMQGSQSAQEELIAGYHDLYRQKAEGISAGLNEQSNRLLGSASSQGYSPDMVRKMLAGTYATGAQQLGAVGGETGYGMHSDIATLTKGTATELAGLKESEIHDILNAYLAKKGLKAQQQGMEFGLAGSVLGAAGTALGGVH